MTKRTIKSFSVKTLAIFLSVLMIFYLIPATAYASLFEAAEAESVVSETTKRAGEVFEDISRREENVKHFRLEDGTYMAAQYDTAVHTLDENGEWQDIDNTLSESGSEYSTSNARIKFAKKITGNESIFTYDEFGKSNSISAGSRGLASYIYNSDNGKLKKITYGNEFFVEYVYDELDNIKEVWYNGTKVYEYTYTAYGPLYRFDNLIDGTSTVYEYDSTGRLVHFTEFDSSDMVNEFSALIGYDAEGRLNTYLYIGAYANSSGVNDWSTSYRNTYHDDGRLKSFSLSADGDITAKTANANVSFTYDKYNRLTGKSYTYTASSQSFTGSVQYTFTETSANTSSKIATYKSSVNGTEVTSTYTYNDYGYITKIVLSTGAEYRYVYDDLGQLKREDNTVTGKTYIYDYDDAGNITSKKTYTLTAAGVTPSGQPSTASYGYNDSWGDLLTSYNGVTISYDAIGNPLSYYNGSSYTFTWKNGRQLATALVNGNTLSFNYNDEGIRTSKTVNGVVHTYHLSGTDIIAEEWGNNLIVYLYDSNGSPMGMQYRTSSMAKGLFYIFWFEKNLQGDIVAVYNSVGTKLVSYNYDAWGNCATTNHNISGTNSYATYNPFRYRGYYYDSELGFYYLNSRYYDPAVGRFIYADVYVSTGQGLLGYNMFAYCLNNPIIYSDHTGNYATLLHNPTDPLLSQKIFECVNGYVGFSASCGIIFAGAVFAYSEDIADAIKSMIDNAINNVEDYFVTKDQSVYVLFDPCDGNIVKYVGRTNDPGRRLTEHQNDPKHPERKGYEMAVFATGLTIPEARLVEQAAISAYTIIYLENARREIAAGKISKHMSYINAITDLIGSYTEDELRNFLGG